MTVATAAAQGSQSQGDFSLTTSGSPTSAPDGSPPSFGAFSRPQSRPATQPRGDGETDDPSNSPGHTASASAAAAAAHSLHLQQRADRAAIDRLLADHRAEIVKLGFLRHNRRLHALVAQSSSSASSALHSGSSALHTARSEIDAASAAAAAVAAMGNEDEDYYLGDAYYHSGGGSPVAPRRSPQKHGRDEPHGRDPVQEVQAFLQARIHEKQVRRALLPPLSNLSRPLAVLI